MSQETRSSSVAECEGTIWHSISSHYLVAPDIRESTSSVLVNRQQHPKVTTNRWWSIPPLLSPLAWQRYQLTESDFKVILKQIPDLSILWQAVHMLRHSGSSSNGEESLDTMSACIKPTPATLFGFVFTRKPQLILTLSDLLIKHGSSSLLSSSSSSLLPDEKQYSTNMVQIVDWPLSPYLPLVPISVDDAHKFQSFVLPQPPSLWQTSHYPEPWMFKEEKYIPVEVTASKYLIFVRIISKSAQQEQSKFVFVKPSIVTQPIEVYVAGELFFLTNEYIAAKI